MFQASLRTSDANEVKVLGIAGALGVKARAPAGKAENDHGDADHPLGFNNDRRAGFDRVCSKIFSGARAATSSISTPPSELAITVTRDVARSITMPR